MRNKLFFFLGVCLVYSTQVLASYSSDDFERFKTSNSCIKCNLSELKFTGNYEASTLDESRLMYCVFTKSNFDRSKFNGAYLTKAETYAYGTNNYMDNFATFRQASFVGAFLNYVQFSSAEFSGSNFERSNLKNADFKNSNLSNTNFSGALVDGINLAYSILIGSNISDEQLLKASSLDCAVMPNGQVFQPSKKECYF